MKFVKGALLLAGAAVLLSACGTTAAAPPRTPAPKTTSSAPSSAPVKTPEVRQIEVKPKGARTVDVAIVKSIDDDVVTWVAGKIVPAESNNVTVVAVEGAQPETAELAADVKFFDALECGEPQGVTLDAEGVGALACTREEYLGMAGHYGTKIVLNDQGEIVRMADRYHP